MIVDATSVRPAVLRAPISKSDAHRALMIGEMLKQSVELPPDVPNDVAVIARALHGFPTEIDCEDAGAPFRMLLTRAAIQPGRPTILTGTARLGERPHDALIDALRASGAEILVEKEPFRVHVKGVEPSGPFRISARESSQFASSLVLGAAALHLREKRTWSVILDGEVASEGYLELTLHWLRQSGFSVTREGNAIHVTAYAPTRMPRIPSDWSALGYLLPIAWKTGSEVPGVDEDALHPDRAIVRHLRGLGLTVENGRVHGTAIRGIDATAKEAPDLVPTLGAIACALPFPSTLRDVSVLRVKESDRVEGILSLCHALGVHATLVGDDIHIAPRGALSSAFKVEARGDHRRVMSAVTAAILVGACVDVDDPACVRKSFPGFFTEVAKVASLQQA